MRSPCGISLNKKKKGGERIRLIAFGIEKEEGVITNRSWRKKEGTGVSDLDFSYANARKTPQKKKNHKKIKKKTPTPPKTQTTNKNKENQNTIKYETPQSLSGIQGKTPEINKFSTFKRTLFFSSRRGDSLKMECGGKGTTSRPARRSKPLLKSGTVKKRPGKKSASPPPALALAGQEGEKGWRDRERNDTWGGGGVGRRGGEGKKGQGDTFGSTFEFFGVTIPWMVDGGGKGQGISGEEKKKYMVYFFRVLGIRAALHPAVGKEGRGNSREGEKKKQACHDSFCCLVRIRAVAIAIPF